MEYTTSEASLQTGNEERSLRRLSFWGFCDSHAPQLWSHALCTRQVENQPTVGSDCLPGLQPWVAVHTCEGQYSKPSVVRRMFTAIPRSNRYFPRT